MAKSLRPEIKRSKKYERAAITITTVQVYPLKQPMGKTRAMARVVLNYQVQLTGLRVVDGVNGLFVSYPNDPGYKGDDYRCLYYPLTKDLREHIEEEVIAVYKLRLKDEEHVDHSGALTWAYDHMTLSDEERAILSVGIDRRASLSAGYLGKVDEDIAILEAELEGLKNRKLVLQDAGLVDKLKARIAKKFGPRGPLVLADEDSEQGHKDLVKLILEGAL